MPDAKEVNGVLLNIHGVNYAVVAHAQPATIRPFQAMMRESMQTCAHLVDPGLDARLKLCRQFEKAASNPL